MTIGMQDTATCGTGVLEHRKQYVTGARISVETNCDNSSVWNQPHRDQNMTDNCDEKKYMTLRSTHQNNQAESSGKTKHQFSLELNNSDQSKKSSLEIKEEKMPKKLKQSTRSSRSKQREEKSRKRSSRSTSEGSNATIKKKRKADKEKAGTKEKADKLVSSLKKKVEKEKDIIEADLKDDFKCPACQKQFDNTHTFTLHIRQHNINDHSHTCKLCGRTLSSASSLDRHMLVHSGERPFKCKVCGMAFTTNGNMHRHMRTHGEEQTDEVKPKKSKNKSLKRSVNDTAEEESLSVQNSSEIGTDKENSEQMSSLLEKQNVEGKVITEVENVSCPVCGKTFLCIYSLESHMETHPNDPIRCQDCGIISNNYNVHQSHTCSALDKKADSSNTSGSSMVGFKDLNFVDFSTPKFSLIAKSFCEDKSRCPSSAYHAFECDWCGKAFPCGRALRLHSVVHTNKIGTYCPSCKCDFSSPACLRAHQLKHRSAEHCVTVPTLPSKEIINSDESSDSGKEDFLALFELQNKDSSVETDISTCNKEKNFESISYFVHGKPEMNVKRDCQTESSNDLADIQSIVSLASTTSLMPNIRSPITGEPASPPPATACILPESPLVAESANASPETPSREESNQSPAKGNTQEKNSVIKSSVEENLTCNECGLSFQAVNALKRHSRSHSQNSTVHKCNVCPYTSMDKSTLMRHLRTHNGERPFQCAICNFAFTTKANCERHVRKRHKKFIADEIRDAMRYNPHMTETKVGNLPSDVGNAETVCKYCNYDFKCNRVLRHHLRSLNNSCSQKPYSCGSCKIGFSTKNNCIRHIVRQHPDMKDRYKEVVIANSIIDTSEEMSSQLSDESPVKDKESKQNEEPLNLALGNINKATFQSLSDDNDLGRIEDIVNAAQSLVSLSQLPPPQDEALDLTVRAIDLRLKSDQQQIVCTEYQSPNISAIFGSSISFEESNLQLPHFEYEVLSNQNTTPLIQPKVSTPIIHMNDTPMNLTKGVLKPVNISEEMHVLDNSLKETIINNQLQHISQSVDTAQQTSLLAYFPKSVLPSTLPVFNNVAINPSAELLLPSNSATKDVSKDSFKMKCKVSKKKPSPKQILFTCVYCASEFTLKSNMERHIKRKHPEYARPARSRNYIPTLSSTSIQKQTIPTLSNKTRDALRTVLSSKVNFSVASQKEKTNNEVLVPISSVHDYCKPNLPIIENENSPEQSRLENEENDKNEAKNWERMENSIDLASVSAVIDTANSQEFKQYLLDAKDNEKEIIDTSKSDENSGSDKSETTSDSVVSSLKNSSNPSKKRSSYTESPNSVSCQYCSRKFPWTSSLRRHILTHTGQKPFKCPKCPIFFTTKSNCERHLSRKHGHHGDIVPRSVPERPYKCSVCPSSSFATQGNLRKHFYLRHLTKTGSGKLKLSDSTCKEKDITDVDASEENKLCNRDINDCNSVCVDKAIEKCINGSETFTCSCCEQTFSDSKALESHLEKSTEYTYKCYICDNAYNKRQECLDHLKDLHPSEYQVLISKGALDIATDEGIVSSPVDMNTVNNNDTEIQENVDICKLKKCVFIQKEVICPFCMQKFGSTDNLQYHMKKHLGEYPYICQVCHHKFSLRSSMVRHQKKHLRASAPSSQHKPDKNGCVEKNNFRPKKCHNSLLYLIECEESSQSSNISEGKCSNKTSNTKPLLPTDKTLSNVRDQDDNGDLIQNLLGIQDSKLLDVILDSADSAARILGVEEV